MKRTLSVMLLAGAMAGGAFADTSNYHRYWDEAIAKSKEAQAYSYEAGDADERGHYATMCTAIENAWDTYYEVLSMLQSIRENVDKNEEFDFYEKAEFMTLDDDISITQENVNEAELTYYNRCEDDDSSDEDDSEFTYTDNEGVERDAWGFEW